MPIAFDYLSPLQQAQLINCRPDLEWRLEHRCKRCGGQVLEDYGELKCFQCSAPHSEEGELIEAKVIVAGKGTHYGPRTPTKRKVR